MWLISEFTNKGRGFEILEVTKNRLCVKVNGRLTQEDLTPYEMIRYLSNALHEEPPYFPMSL